MNTAPARTHDHLSPCLPWFGRLLCAYVHPSPHSLPSRVSQSPPPTCRTTVRAVSTHGWVIRASSGLLTHPWVASGARKRTREGDQHFIWAGPKGPFPGPEMKPHSGRFRCVCSGCRVSRCSARSCEAGPGRNTYQGTVGLSSAPPSPGQRGVRGRRSPRLWYPVLSGVGGAVLRGLGGLARRYGSIRACGGALGGLGACWALNW